MPTAGLKAPPEIVPALTAPAKTVSPIASPKKELFSCALVVAALRTTVTRAKVQMASTVRAKPAPTWVRVKGEGEG